MGVEMCLLRVVLSQVSKSRPGAPGSLRYEASQKQVLRLVRAADSLRMTEYR
jgi:hypothetical protein